MKITNEMIELALNEIKNTPYRDHKHFVADAFVNFFEKLDNTFAEIESHEFWRKADSLI